MNVALPTNLAPEDVAAVINEAELVGVACAPDELPALAPVLRLCTTLRCLLVMDARPPAPAQLVQQARPCTSSQG